MTYDVIEEDEDEQVPSTSDQEVLPPDPLSVCAKEIEALHSKSQAIDMMTKLLADETKNWIQQGGILLKMKENGWTDDYNSIEEMAQDLFQFGKTKAYEIIFSYRMVRDGKLSWEVADALGPSKLRLLCRMARAGKWSAEEFSARAEYAKPLTCKKLKSELDQLNGSTNGDGPKFLTFKPYPGQLANINNAIERVIEQGSAKSVTEALNLICIEHTGGPDLVKAIDLAEVGLAKTLALLSEHDPESDPENIVVEYLHELGEDRALALVHKAFPDLELPAV